MSDNPIGPDCDSCKIGTMRSSRWLIGALAGWLAWGIFLVFFLSWIAVLYERNKVDSEIDENSKVKHLEMRGSLAAQLLKIPGINTESVASLLTADNLSNVEIEATTESARRYAKELIENFSDKLKHDREVRILGLQISRAMFAAMTASIVLLAVPTSIIGARRSVWVCPGCRKFWDRC